MTTLVVIPLEQGLKRGSISLLTYRVATLVVIPLEQGLKPDNLHKRREVADNSRSNSIRTRIETLRYGDTPRQGFWPQRTLVVIPLEQGLKPSMIPQVLYRENPTLVVIPLEQGLKRA